MPLRVRTRWRSTFQKFIVEDDAEFSNFKQLHFFYKYFRKTSRTVLSGLHATSRGCILKAWVIVCSSYIHLTLLSNMNIKYVILLR